ncbi:MAG: DmsE family decaheme c-type cytochrome [Nitrospirota bacterium]
MLVAAAPAAHPQQPPYSGSEACGTCHEDIFKAFAKNPHHSVETSKKKGFEGQACESCHGPGAKHAESGSAEDIRNPAKLTAAQADRACMACHMNEPTHAGRIQSSHAKNLVACTSCHQIHANGPFGLVARKPADINRQCAACHQNVWAQFTRPFKHRLPENAMSCVDCHNPHGSFRPGMLQTASANEPGCFRCHGDKRGPFAFEHAPVRFDGCWSCHEPHGSANPRMLVRHEVRFVCLECHANLPATAAGGTRAALGVVPPAFHDLRSPRFQNCAICHQKVHGSHVDRNLLR